MHLVLDDNIVLTKNNSVYNIGRTAVRTENWLNIINVLLSISCNNYKQTLHKMKKEIEESTILPLDPHQPSGFFLTPLERVFDANHTIYQNSHLNDWLSTMYLFKIHAQWLEPFKLRFLEICSRHQFKIEDIYTCTHISKLYKCITDYWIVQSLS